MATEATMQPFIFDASIHSKTADIPQQLVWSESDRPTPGEELDLPVIDLGAFLSRKCRDSIDDIVRQVGDACRKHGFFQVTNHGVDPEMLDRAQRLTQEFFKLGLEEKERGKKKFGKLFGYASSFTGRYESNLPWMETFTIPASSAERHMVEAYGQGLQHYGSVLQDFCSAMSKLCLEIMEVLGLSLGVGQSTFREFYEDNESFLGVNYYPICPRPDLTLGNAPHHDPTSLTVLHQDGVAGLQVSIDGKWYNVSPKPNTFAVNIGDTFMALTNKQYKSCVHRVTVNSKEARKTLAFFLCPKKDKIVRPPMSLVDEDHPRAFPDFTWGELEEFTQKHHRADTETTTAFTQWLQKNKESVVSA